MTYLYDNDTDVLLISDLYDFRTQYVIYVDALVGSGLFEARLQYVSDSAQRVVFTCLKPSIIMTYDTQQCTHTVWNLRKVTPEVWLLHAVLMKCIRERYNITEKTRSQELCNKLQEYRAKKAQIR